MRALTIRPEPARAILEGKKKIEYRKWSTNHRGPLVIHASKPDGVLLCIVDVVDVKWNGRVFEWELKNVRPIQQVPVRGQCRLWNIDDAKVKRL